MNDISSSRRDFLGRAIGAGLGSSLVGVLGCGRRRVGSRPAFEEKAKDFVVAQGFDISGSFSGTEARAWKFFQALTGQLLQLGSKHNHLIVGRIDGTSGIPWEGHPRSFQWDSQEQFKEFLHAGETAGSAVFDGFRKIVEAVLRVHKQGTTTRSMIALMTDMEENSSAAGAEQKLIAKLQEYGTRKGTAVGIYWCNRGFVDLWETRLRSYGIEQVMVTPDTLVDPKIPNLRR